MPVQLFYCGGKLCVKCSETPSIDERRTPVNGARILASGTGTVEQELPVSNDYMVVAIRILKTQVEGHCSCQMRNVYG
jgi:hypothetical protein